MNPDDMSNQRALLDRLYGVPSLGEQDYFRKGGVGPPTEAMQHQQEPFGREQDAFNPIKKDPKSLAFIDRIENGKATVLHGDNTVTIPTSVLPKGISEGQSFDPETGKIVDSKGEEMGELRGKMGQDDEGGEIKL